MNALIATTALLNDHVILAAPNQLAFARGIHAPLHLLEETITSCAAPGRRVGRHHLGGDGNATRQDEHIMMSGLPPEDDDAVSLAIACLYLRNSHIHFM